MKGAWFRFLASGLLLAWSVSKASPDPISTNAADASASDPLSSEMTVIRPAPLTDGILRNPAMGWMIYMEPEGGSFPPCAQFWKTMEPYVPMASILYIRCTWAKLEPQEGHYAWSEDSNLQAIMDEATRRGLKLAFRVIVNSKDCQTPASPDWVQEAGAQGYMVGGQGGKQLWTPSVQDPVFREKFQNFVAAFAQKFDDPSRVDFVDGGSLGWWGEMHHIDPAVTSDDQKKEILQWVLGTYAGAFHNVLLALNMDPGHLEMACNTYGYVIRRDSMGGFWYNPDQRKQVMTTFAKVPFIAECCYFSIANWTDQWKKDPRNYQTPRDVLQGSYQDAIDSHANTLDLRGAHDAAEWVKDAPDLVNSFLVKGGYRLYPVSVEIPLHFAGNQPVTIHHAWKNLGVGILPNDNLRWNRKYRVAFALLDPETKTVVSSATDPNADPGTWLTGQEWPNTCAIAFSPTPPPGAYLLALAIVNTQDGNKPEIRLAAADLEVSDGWSLLAKVRVETPDTARN